MARIPKRIAVAAKVVAEEMGITLMPSCVQCARLMETNTPERWANEPGNHDKAWWNLMDFYCPHCHSFQNAGDDARNRYVKPSGKYLETGRTFVTVRACPPTMFEGNNP